MSRPTPKQMRLLIGSARRYARGASELLALVSLPSPPDLYELSATFITVLRAASELKSAIDRTRKGGGSPTDGWPHPAHNPLLVIYHRFTHMIGEIESMLGVDVNRGPWDKWEKVETLASRVT